MLVANHRKRMSGDIMRRGGPDCRAAETTAFEEAREQETDFFSVTQMHVEQEKRVLSFDRRLTRR